MLSSLLIAGSLIVTASAKNDSNPYVPRETSCPSDLTYIRSADSLSPGEQNFLKSRDENTREQLIDWLGKSNLSNFDASQFLSNQTIRIGLAYSGGGYRAMLCGAGQLAALDNRTTNSTDSGHLGGLLQATTYLAGLSGGNWLVGSIVVNNFTSVQELQNDSKLWHLDNSILNPGKLNIFKTFSYWDTIIDDVEAKKDAGWNVSLTDLWGRGLSYQFVNATEGGEGYSYSNIRDYDAFKNAEMPFPIHVTDRRDIMEKIISLNSSVFEFNPFEIGSWDPNIYHFADLKYLGTEVNNGKVSDTNNCTVGYDNAGFLIGTSATLFNQFLLQINGTGIQKDIKDLAEKILNDMSEKGDDISLIQPNPFYNLNNISDSSYELLTLVDGGEDGMNVPIYPLQQPQRNVDIIFAFDNSADTDNYWPNGTSLVDTYNRQFGSQGNGTHFPYVPDADTFYYGGLVGQPTFFGCNLTNLTSLYGGSGNVNNTTFSGSDPSNVPPVVVYIANSEHSYASNVDTFKLKYSNNERDQLIENGYNVMTQNNGTLDSEWRSAVGCAIILREQQRRGQSPTEQCQRLLQSYCWDGSTNTSAQNSNITTPLRRDGKSNVVSNSTADKKKKKKNAAISTSVLDKRTALLAAVLGAASFLL